MWYNEKCTEKRCENFSVKTVSHTLPCLWVHSGLKGSLDTVSLTFALDFNFTSHKVKSITLMALVVFSFDLNQIYTRNDAFASTRVHVSVAYATACNLFIYVIMD